MCLTMGGSIAWRAKPQQLTQAKDVAPSFTKNINYAYNNKGALHGTGTNLLGRDANTTTNVIVYVSSATIRLLRSIP